MELWIHQGILVEKFIETQNYVQLEKAQLRFKISNSKKYFKIICTTTNNKTIFAINFKERGFRLC